MMKYKEAEMRIQSNISIVHVIKAHPCKSEVFVLSDLSKLISDGTFRLSLNFFS